MGFFKRKNKEQKKPTITWHVPDGTEDFLVPKRATPGSMAFDLIAPTDVVVKPIADPVVGGSVLVNTLVAVTLPPGYAMILGSRSGLAAKHNITVEAGWIDNDYRGIIKVVLYNHGSESYKISSGERIAQARLVKVVDVEECVEWKYPDPSATKRGSGGFGSTGK